MYQLLASLPVFILLNDITNGLFNAALYKPAVQSSTFYVPYIGTLWAHLAVDGNKNTDAHNGHCQHTEVQNMPWWMVDLRGQFVVDTIRITNRMDYDLYTRLQNFRIDIFDQDPRQLTNFPNITGNVCYREISNLLQVTLNITCSPPITGRFVRLLMNVTLGVLDVCEIEVFVSDFLTEQRLFTIREDTKLSGTVLDTVTVRDPASCMLECLTRISSTCTAFNWDTTSKTCDLFSVNPNLDLTSYLTSAPGTNFYIQDNNF